MQTLEVQCGVPPRLPAADSRRVLARSDSQRCTSRGAVVLEVMKHRSVVNFVGGARDFSGLHWPLHTWGFTHVDSSM